MTVQNTRDQQAWLIIPDAAIEAIMRQLNTDRIRAIRYAKERLSAVCETEIARMIAGRR
jgi:hypothetical protein